MNPSFSRTLSAARMLFPSRSDFDEDAIPRNPRLFIQGAIVELAALCDGAFGVKRQPGIGLRWRRGRGRS